MRWVVFNGFSASDGYAFHVYVDAPDEGAARTVATRFFEYLAVKWGASHNFADPTRFTAIPVSAT